jgi:hypothetical protein
MEDSHEVEYEYQTKPILSVIGMLMFFGMSYAGVSIVSVNEKALRLFGTTLSATVINVIMWVFAAVTFYVGCKLALAFIQALKGPRSITLTKTGITAPANVTSRKYTTVDFTNITNLKLRKNSGKLFLHIHHKKGKVVIPSVAMENDGLFQELMDKLNLATKAQG